MRNFKVNNRSVNFGFYINADDIAFALREGSFNFDEYDIKVKNPEFIKTCINSGLTNEKFPESVFKFILSIKRECYNAF